MKLNFGERLITNNPLRAFIQRRVEGPMLKRMAGFKSYPLCLEIGCRTGVGAEIIVEQFGAEKVIATDADPEHFYTLLHKGFIVWSGGSTSDWRDVRVWGI